MAIKSSDLLIKIIFSTNGISFSKLLGLVFVLLVNYCKKNIGYFVNLLNINILLIYDIFIKYLFL
jgi:hypothetical protein